MDDQTKVFRWLCSPKVADVLEGESTGFPFRTFSVKNFVSIKRDSSITLFYCLIGHKGTAQVRQPQHGEWLAG